MRLAAGRATAYERSVRAFTCLSESETYLLFSTRRAISTMETSSASAIAITAAQDGFACPRSIPERWATVIPARWATASCVSPVLLRSSRIAAPSAGCGLLERRITAITLSDRGAAFLSSTVGLVI
jgi:hypothetical protein